MSVIDLAAHRPDPNAPDADCLRHDDAGQQLQLYALSYRMGDAYWATEVWAYSLTDAEARVAAMRESLAVAGQIVGRSA